MENNISLEAAAEDERNFSYPGSNLARDIHMEADEVTKIGTVAAVLHLSMQHLGHSNHSTIKSNYSLRSQQ